jgi:hypothetical protein
MNEDLNPPHCPSCGSYDWSYWYSSDQMKCGDCGFFTTD